MIAKIEAVVGRKVFLSRGGVDQKMACELCVALLNQIQTLEQQLLSCKTDLASKYASANSAPVKRSRFDLEQITFLKLIFFPLQESKEIETTALQCRTQLGQPALSVPS